MLQGKLEISPVWGKLQIKFPVRTKETKAIMVLLNNHLKLGFVTRKMVPQKCMSCTFHLWTALSKSLFQFVNNVA